MELVVRMVPKNIWYSWSSQFRKAVHHIPGWATWACAWEQSELPGTVGGIPKSSERVSTPWFVGEGD